MTLLLLLLALAVVAGVAAVAAGLVTGGLDDPVSSVPPRGLPPGPIHPGDLAQLRFAPALRGYRMDQVDAAIDRLAEEIDRLQAELAARHGTDDGGVVAGVDPDRWQARPSERDLTEPELTGEDDVFPLGDYSHDLSRRDG